MTAAKVKELVRACADGVAHAVSGLSPSEISVIVNGASIKVPDTDNDPLGASDDLMDLREKREAKLEQKIRNEFMFIDGLTVSVNCDVENRTMDQKSDEYDKTKILIQPEKIRKVNDADTSSAAAVSHEPGASANTGANGAVSLDGSAKAGPLRRPTPRIVKRATRPIRFFRAIHMWTCQHPRGKRHV